MADPIYSKAAFSESADGLPIKIVANATPGTLIHTAAAITGDNNKDEVYLWLSNSSASDVEARVEFGGVADPDNHMVHTVPAKQSILACPGIPIQNAKEVRVFAGTANVLTGWGFVNKIRPA